MQFDIISIIYVVIVLIFLGVGIKKGFFKTLVSLIKNILSFIFAAFLSDPIAKTLLSTSLGTSLNGKLLEFFNSKGSLYTTTVTEESLHELISNGLNNIHLPESVHSTIFNSINKMVDLTAKEYTVGEVLAQCISYFIFLVVAFLILFIIIRIITGLLNKLFESLEQIPLIGSVNKLLGGAINLVIGVLFICLISYGLTFVVPLDNQFSTWVIETMKLNENDVFTISKFFYENNFLTKIITWIQNLFLK